MQCSYIAPVIIPQHVELNHQKMIKTDIVPSFSCPDKQDYGTDTRGSEILYVFMRHNKALIK